MKRCVSCGTAFEGGDWACPRCGFAPEVDDVVRFPVDVPKEAFPWDCFAGLPELEPKSFWFRSRNELIAWALRRYFGDARSLLEVGCGTGFVLQGLAARFPSLALAGAEPFERGLEVARSRLPGVPLYLADGQALPFEREFDVVGCFDVLEHVHSDDRVLHELHRALVPGGGALITVPNHRWLWGAVDEFSGHVRRYTRRELVRKVTDAGFRVLRVTAFVGLLLPLVAASRFAHRGSGAEYDPATEYRLPSAIDRILGAVLAAERGLIRLGVSLPAGSSLLLVASRR